MPYKKIIQQAIPRDGIILFIFYYITLNVL